MGSHGLKRQAWGLTPTATAQGRPKQGQPPRGAAHDAKRHAQGLTNSQSHFQAGQKAVFNPVPQAPVTASTYSRLGIPEVAFAERLDGLGMAPTVHNGVRGLGAYAGDFGKGLEQFGLDAFSVILKVAL